MEERDNLNNTRVVLPLGAAESCKSGRTLPGGGLAGEIAAGFARVGAGGWPLAFSSGVDRMGAGAWGVF